MLDATIIGEELKNKLESTGVGTSITFDPSAIDKLVTISDGDLGVAMLYAGPAVIDALEEERKTIGAENVGTPENFGEMIRFTRGGKSPWDVVKKVTDVNVGNEDLIPTAAGIRRILTGMETNRLSDCNDAEINNRLPKYALVDKIQYKEKDDMGGPRIIIPFKYQVIMEEINATLHSFVKFVEGYADERQLIKEISKNDTIGMLISADFSINPKVGPGADMNLVHSNYRVRSRIGSSIDEGQGMITIEKEFFCKHEGILEAYIDSLK